MKSTLIAVASVAYMAASASAFSWGCQQEHYYGAKDIAVDVRNIKSGWNKNNPFGSTVTKDGKWVRVECTRRGNFHVTPLLSDCSDALDWLWNTVNAPGSDYLDKKGLVPRSCSVDNETIMVTWSSK
ncbi:hypothetical protein CPB97_004522 [Podila verticillata]|nr:hypothetical protein CPB97_004522 [Podila verticillata]